MITHHDLCAATFSGKRELLKLIRQQTITLAGNRQLKIYGTLNCASGKRMKTVNRVFFTNKRDAMAHGYRPCGHCMPKEYQQWKKANA